jgi:hypothetical protein
MCDPANATLALATAAPHRIGTPSLSLSCLSTFNFRLSTVNHFLFNVSTFKPSNMPTFFVLSSAFSYPCKLFCTLQKLNSFVSSKSELFYKNTRGWGYLLPLYEDQNETANC